MESVNNIIRIAVTCVSIAILIGIATVIFAWWFLHQIEKNCDKKDLKTHNYKYKN